jgi:dimethylargininase
VEDVAVVVDEVAVLTIPGAPSRQPEVPTVATALGRFRELAWLAPPATLDGGDVLRVDRTIYVGRSGRTSEAGIGQLEAHLAPFGYTVQAVDVSGCLHLKSACTYLGDGVMLVNPEWLDLATLERFEVIPVDPAEPRAGNTFRVGATLITADNFPRTRRRIEERGFTVRTVPLTELQKAEAGGSCMSLVFSA